MATPRIFILATRTSGLQRRFISNTSAKRRDVLSRFHPPPPSEQFLTSSTKPAGTSFQEVPRPGAISGDAELQAPVPAMQPPAPPAGSAAEEGIDVRGVHVPPKPRPPGDEECCMSGCVHCVYTIYAEELEEYAGQLEKARAALVSANIPQAEWPVALQADQGEGGGQDMVEKAKKQMEDNMDPTMAAFFALENKLKKKQAPESSAASVS